MKFVKRVLSHLVLIVLVLVVIAAFIYRDVWFPFLFETRQDVATVDEVADTDGDVDVEAGTEVSVDTAQAERDQYVTQAPRSTSPEREMNNAPARQPLQDRREVSTSQNQGSSFNQAREAAWRGDFQRAEQHYRNLIASNSRNPDAYGELGDVYYKQGRRGEAADMYAQAAELLAENDQRAEADRLLYIVAELDFDRAQQLRQSLYQSQR